VLGVVNVHGNETYSELVGMLGGTKWKSAGEERGEPHPKPGPRPDPAVWEGFSRDGAIRGG
jgi:hypothetical protein